MTGQIEQQLCSKCRRPRSLGGNASLTQWLSTCQCDAAVETMADGAVQTCEKCRLRIKPNRGGSITQWIFSENFCKCASPVISRTSEPLKPVDENESRIDATIEYDESYCEVDAENFPVERYRPLKLIGKGALGEVYLCRDLLLRKKVAVKCLIQLVDENIVAFQSEAKIASKLNHPNVIRVLDFGTASGGRPFMVMEYFPGSSLADLIAQTGGFSESDVLQLAELLCSALQFLHESKVYHRDLKPSNILVARKEDGTLDVRIIDFGLSKTTQHVQSKTIVDGRTIVGTPGYMSPDQINGRSYDARSEIYSLGCILFEAASGSPPYQSDNPMQLLQMHAQDDVPRLTCISVELSEMIAKCMSKNQEDRFASCSQLLEFLDDIERSSAAVLQAPPPVSDFISSAPVVSTSKSLVSVPGFVAIGAFAFALGMVASAFWQDPSIRYLFTGQESSNQFRLGKGLALSEESRLVLQEPVTLKSSDAILEIEPDGKRALVTAVSLSMDLRSVLRGRQFSTLTIQAACLGNGDAECIASSNVTELRVGDCNLPRGFLGELAKCPKLNSLDVSGVDKLTPLDFSKLAALPDLQKLVLRRCDLTDDYLLPLGKIRSLNYLDISENPFITVAGLRSFVPLSGRRLNLIVDDRLSERIDERDELVLKNRNVHLQSAVGKTAKKPESMQSRSPASRK